MSVSPTERWREPGALAWLIAVVVGALWLVGAPLALAVLLGVEGLAHATATEWGAIAAAVILPALMAVFSGLAARDSTLARAEARRLADAADRLMNPERSSDEATRKLAVTVRGEIGTLDRALEATLTRLQDIEAQIQRQAQLVNAMSDQAKAGANQMIVGMEREREELLGISQDLTQHAQTIGASISRHTQLISDAARQAEAEVRAADQALDTRLTSFGAAAALISDRTSHLTAAAQASADSALRLEHALSNALEALGKASNLTDAARQSAEAASLAATSTAGAVRDTTDRAIDDAKRAADLIRGEAAAIEQEAAIALERLREAAEAAREAAIGARTAIEDDVAPAVRRRSRDREDYDASRRSGGEDYDASRRSGGDDPLESPPPPRGRREPTHERNVGGGAWTWRDLMSSAEDGQGRPPPRREAEDPVGHLKRRNAPSPENLPVIGVVDRAGLRLDDVFSPSALERIAQRARSGANARRRAVQDAAPDATRDLAGHLANDADDNQEAMQFLKSEGARIADLIARGRASMNAEATRAFLLLDAAAG